MTDRTNRTLRPEPPGRAGPTGEGADQAHAGAGREHDLSLLAWLQSWSRLPADTTGLICDALLDWVALGYEWPSPVPPPDCAADHLGLLMEVTGSVAAQATQARSVAGKLALAGLARTLTHAARCQSDPDGAAAARARELLSRTPPRVSQRETQQPPEARWS